MNCHICGQSVQPLETVHDGNTYCCEGCGTYVLSGSLLAEQASTPRKFEVDRTRLWLTTERLKGVQAPVIKTTNAIWA
ncbi:hypothetical protein HNR03_000154 [Pseudomonas sp. JAI111]|nr:hypothetical protein [Pseudomonas sp. JAI111]